MSLPDDVIEFAPELPSVVGWLEDAASLLAEPDPGPTPYLVESLIVDQAIAMIPGPAKARKTWTALELAVSIHTGRPAFGEFAIPQPGPVIVVLEESGRAAFHRRLSALARGNAIETPEFVGFHFATNRGVRLDDHGWQEKLLKAAAAIEPRAIFLDPLVRMKGAGRDENAEKEMGPVLEFMRELREQSGAAVVFVHHTGHIGNHARGTSDFEGYWESRLGIAPTKTPATTSVTPQHREAEQPDPFKWRFGWDSVTRSVRLTLDAEDAEALKRKKVRAYLEAHPDASANEVHREVGGRRTDILALVSDVREGGSDPAGTSAEPGTGPGAGVVSPRWLFRAPGTGNPPAGQGGSRGVFPQCRFGASRLARRARAGRGGGRVTERLPELLDAKRLQAELGITRAVAEKVMRQLPVVTFPDVRKVYVRRSDVARLIEERTFGKDQVPA